MGTKSKDYSKEKETIVSLAQTEIFIDVSEKLALVLDNFKNSNNKLVALSEYIGEKVVVLTFYRGGWCPYCMLELESYQQNLEDFEKAGSLVIAVSPDSVMNAKKTKKKRDAQRKN